VSPTAAAPDSATPTPAASPIAPSVQLKPPLDWITTVAGCRVTTGRVNGSSFFGSPRISGDVCVTDGVA
jgi:hypothetical protein